MVAVSNFFFFCVTQIADQISFCFLIEITWLAYDFTPSSFVYAVPISTIATFHKMKKLTRDHALIVSALKESSFLVSFFIADLVVTCSMNGNRWIN